MLNHSDLLKPNDFMIEIDCFDPAFSLKPTILASFTRNTDRQNDLKSNSDNRSMSTSLQMKTTRSDVRESQNNNDIVSNPSTRILNLIDSNTKNVLRDHLDAIKKANFIQANNKFKNFLYVYPKSLKFDCQKAFSKARNILIKIELREIDTVSSEYPVSLGSVYKLNPNFSSIDDNNLLVNEYLTSITHHNKNPQFYDEIKFLLPLNLTEKHHVLFRFYHVSCSTAKSSLVKDTNVIDRSISGDKHVYSNNNLNQAVKNIENPIGFAWLPIFKQGRLLSGEKNLPIAQNLINNYLSSQNDDTDQAVSTSDIKWVENMKPLFKVNIIPYSTVHTTVIRYILGVKALQF